MGDFGWLWFGEADKVFIEEIAKHHNVPVEIVEVYYKKMLENIKNEVKK